MYNKILEPYNGKDTPIKVETSVLDFFLLFIFHNAGAFNRSETVATSKSSFSFTRVNISVQQNSYPCLAR